MEAEDHPLVWFRKQHGAWQLGARAPTEPDDSVERPITDFRDLVAASQNYVLEVASNVRRSLGLDLLAVLLDLDQRAQG